MSGEHMKNRKAVALSYDDQKMPAPVVVAKGKGDIAQRIVEQAQKYDIPIQEDPSLVELLSQINLNQQIPEELFKVVAEVFAFIYRLDRQSTKKD